MAVRARGGQHRRRPGERRGQPRARRAKTDRLDADKLLAMLVRHHGGERVWSVLREPSPSDEDARCVHRELQLLVHERIAHKNRISSLLVLHNLRPRIVIGGRDWPAWWNEHREQEVPTSLRADTSLTSTQALLAPIERSRVNCATSGCLPSASSLARARLSTLLDLVPTFQARGLAAQKRTLDAV